MQGVMYTVNYWLTGNATSLVDVPLDGYCTTDLQCDAATHGATCAIPDGEDTAVCSCVDPLQPHEGETPVCYFAAYQENCIESKDCLSM